MYILMDYLIPFGLYQTILNVFTSDVAEDTTYVVMTL